ncbi:MAG: 4-hydroxybenzoate octaprenyltransferase, partial [Chloroflexi bacterium]|nr:4-hydroxybenzoate octaprenyltransferase [Chloroflexota bacterium]
LAGFDIIYACQDIDVDRQQGLFSVPSRFGLARGLQIARACHVVTIIFFGAVGVVCGLGVTYWVGVMGAAGLLIYEHSIVSPDDLSKMNIAFFNVNGFLAVSLFLMTSGDLLVGWFFGR